MQGQVQGQVHRYTDTNFTFDLCFSSCELSQIVCQPSNATAIGLFFHLSKNLVNLRCSAWASKTFVQKGLASTSSDLRFKIYGAAED